MTKITVQCLLSRERNNQESTTLQKSFFLLIFKIILFIYLWLCWVFTAIAMCWLLTSVASLVAECRLQGTQASVVVAHRFSGCGSRALEHRLSSCGTRAQWFCGMWDPPRPGIETCHLHWQADSPPLAH